MNRRSVLLFFMAFAVCALVAQEPAEPPRLKKKKRDGAPPPEVKKEMGLPKEELPKEKDEPNPVKGKEPPVKGLKGKEAPAKDEPIVPEDGERGDPGEDDKDILERIGKNMRAVEDKLSNKELGETTEQQQRDILKDIDALIRRSEQGGGGGGGAGGAADMNQDNNDQGQKGENQPKGDGQQGGGKQGGGKQGGGQQGGGQQESKSRAQQRKESREQAQNAGRQRREMKSGGTKMAGGPQPQPQPQPGGMGQSQPKPAEGGNEPRAVKGGPMSDKLNPAELAKEIWGHLPESLRAEMNAYSNPQPFMPRYDDLIKKYYRAIAEKGRKKGD